MSEIAYRTRAGQRADARLDFLGYNLAGIDPKELRRRPRRRDPS